MDLRVVALSLCLLGLTAVTVPEPVDASCHGYYPPCRAAHDACRTFQMAVAAQPKVDSHHPCFLWMDREEVVIGGANYDASVTSGRFGKAWYAMNTTAATSRLSLSFKNPIPDYSDLASVTLSCAYQKLVLPRCGAVDFTPLGRQSHIHVPFQIRDDAGKVIEEGLFTLELPVVEKIDWPSFNIGAATGAAVVGLVSVGAWFYVRRTRA